MNTTKDKLKRVWFLIWVMFLIVFNTSNFSSYQANVVDVVLFLSAIKSSNHSLPRFRSINTDNSLALFLWIWK